MATFNQVAHFDTSGLGDGPSMDADFRRSYANVDPQLPQPEEAQVAEVTEASVEVKAAPAKARAKSKATKEEDTNE